MDQRSLRRDFVSVVQCVQNLSCVLALNPNHSAALASLRDALDTVISSDDPGLNEALVKLATDLRGFLEGPMDQDDVVASTECAARFHNVTVAINAMAQVREPEMSTEDHVDA